MIDKSKRKATAEQAGSVVVVRMTGGPDCLWLNMYLDTASRVMVCDSDIGSYAYPWGKYARAENFIEFCCRWLSDEAWLLRKCVGERHIDKAFLREKAEAALREMIIEYNADDEDFDADSLDDMVAFAACYASEPKAWALAIQTYADARGYDLPEEWYECIKEDYTPWQKRFAEICRDVIVPELEKLSKGGDTNA